MRVVTLGTAGHIDHGKTALVRALTGIDTDRLPEEKRRGITIDLGFAHLDLNSELRIAIVDVPGHETFVRNMTAGATGIDLGLLVIAADEGIMPQTREHLAILELLEVPPAGVVLSKIDLVDPDWLDLVQDDVKASLTGRYGQAPILRVSAKTGAGLEELRSSLHAAAAEITERDRTDVFRLPVDRVFTVRGTGTVVTGTVWSGQLMVDQTVRLMPSGETARVRALQRQNEAAQAVRAGERAAVALASLPLEAVARGETLVTDQGWDAARTLTAFVRLLPDAGRPLQTRQRVHVYLGTASVLARVYPLAGPVEPGAEGWVLLFLEEPLLTRAGDRLIIRSYSPVTTIGGGEVLEWSATPYRRRAQHLPLLEILRSGEPGERVASAIALTGWQGIPRQLLPLRVRGHREGDLHRSFVAGARCFSPELASNAGAELFASLAALHQAQPYREAIDAEQLRSAQSRKVTPDLRDAVITHAIMEGRIVERSGGLALKDWTARVNFRHQLLRPRILEILETAGCAPPDRDELAASVGPEAPEILRALAAEGQVVAVTRDLFITAAAAREAETRLRTTLAKGPQTVPGLKAVLGLSRKHLIPLLEHFDRVGLTRRNGDLRILAQLEKVSDLKDATA